MPLNLSGSIAGSRDVRLAMRDARRAIYAVWHKGANGAVEFQRLRDRGASIANQLTLGTNDDVELWANVAAGPSSSTPDRDFVHVAWVRLKRDDWSQQEVVFTRSTDGGESFSQPQAISARGTNFSPPLVRAAGKCVHVAWHQADPTPTAPNRRTVWLARSRDYGRSWTRQRIDCAPITLDQFNTVPASFERPSDLDIAVSENGRIVALAYPSLGKKPRADAVVNLIVAVSKDGGESFACMKFLPAAMVSLVTEGPGNSCGRPRLTMSRKTLHVSCQFHFPRGVLMYRWLRLPNLVANPALTELPVTFPLFTTPPIERHAMAAAEGPAAFVFSQDAGQRCAVFTGAAFAAPLATGDLDPDYPGGATLLYSKALVAVPGMREPAWCAAGPRWPPSGPGAVRATVFGAASASQIATSCTTVHPLAQGESVKHVHVYADPAAGGRVFVIWEGGPSGAPSGDILLARSLNGGRTFS